MPVLMTHTNSRKLEKVPVTDPVMRGTVGVMSKAERIKEAIGWLKIVFAALVAVDVSLIAWLAQNFQRADNVLVVLALLSAVCTTTAIIGVNHVAFRRISELENL